MNEITTHYLSELAEKVGLGLASKSIINYLLEKTKSIFNGNVNDFQKELISVIDKALNDYVNLYSKSHEIKDNKKPFYESEKLLELLIQFRLNEKPQLEDFLSALQKDKLIIEPTSEQLTNFLELFDKHIAESQKLFSLDIKNNYQEEIYKISDKLNDIGNNVLEIKELFKNSHPDLLEEWRSQLDNVESFLDNFKPKSALSILENLENRISDKNINNSNLISKISYLKAICYTEFDSSVIMHKSAELFIKAYNLSNQNSNYISNAGLSYYYLGDKHKAAEISEKILQDSEYNIYGWLIKCYLKNIEYLDIYNIIPEYVKNQSYFKIQLIHWLLNQKIIQHISDLDNLGISINLNDTTEPKVITRKNRAYYKMISMYFLNKAYEKSRVIYALAKASEEFLGDEDFKYSHRVFKKIDAAIKDTEISNTDMHAKFQFHYIDYLATQNHDNIKDIIDSFNLIENKTYVEVMQVAQVYNSLQNTEKSIEILDTFGDDGNEHIFVMYCINYNILNQIEKAEDYLKKYVHKKGIIDSEVFYNLIKFIETIYDDTIENVKERIDILIKGVPFISIELESLFRLYLPLLTNHIIEKDEPFKNDLKNIQVFMDENMFTHLIARILIHNHLFNEAVDYLRPRVNLTKPSDEYMVYCIALFGTKNNKHEVLPLLENWRKNFNSPNRRFLHNELRLRHVVKDWKNITEICEYGNKHFPDDEMFVTFLIAGHHEARNFDKIRELKDLVFTVNFEYENNPISLSKMLSDAELHEESVELLYSIAIKPYNNNAKKEFVNNFLTNPKFINLFKPLELVSDGTFVLIEIERHKKIVPINEKSSHSVFYKLLINKKAGDNFGSQFSENKIGSKSKSGKVLMVMNKYLALHEQILMDIGSPTNEVEIDMIEFPPDANPVEVINNFVKKYGADGTLRKDHNDEMFTKYYSGEISFSELAIDVFSNNYVDAYFYVTRSGQCFKSLSKVFSPEIKIDSETKFVLDFTSICLFYELSKTHNIQFEHTFIIPPTINSILQRIITEIEFSPSPKMSLGVTYDKTEVFKYPENFIEKRVEHFKSIQMWLQNNCVIETVEEKVNFLADLKEDVISDPKIESLLECRLLTDRANYILLTNDIVYHRLFKANQNTVSPEVYFEKYFTAENLLKTSSHQINNKYVGIHISDKMWQEALANLLTHKGYNFTTCLNNLNFYWNPDIRNINDIVLFLKWLELASLISEDKKNELKESILKSLLFSIFNDTHIRVFNYFLGQIGKEFKLLILQRQKLIEMIAKILGQSNLDNMIIDFK